VLAGLLQGVDFVGGLAILYYINSVYFISDYFYNTHQVLKGLVALLFYFLFISF
jgi:hypothetical protein